MFIEKLILSGYDRLSVRGIEYFEISFASIYQMIIGTNGSGKSSVKAELSPLPALTSNYNKGGYKKIWLSHKGRKYYMESNFSTHAGHTFVVDDQTLNDHGTATIQRQLVKEHFGLTQEIFDVLSGESRFTDMTSLERREWMIRLSGIDLNLAIKAFQAFKTALRDSIGYTKTCHKRLHNELAKQISEDEFTALVKEQAELQQDLNKLLKRYSESEHTPAGVIKRFNSVIDDIEDAHIQVKEARLELPQKLKEAGVKSLSELNSWYEVANFRLSDLDKEKRELYSERQKITGVLDEISQAGASGIGDLKKSIETIEEQMAHIQCLDPMFFYEEHQVDAAVVSFESIYPLLKELYFEIEDNSDGKYSKETYNKAHSDLKDKQALLTQINQRVFKIEHKLEHIKDTAHTNCPECNFSFIPGVAPNFEVKAKEALTNYDEDKAKLNEEIAKLTEFLDRYNLFKNYAHRIHSVVESNKVHSALWDLLRSEHGLYNKNPKAVLAVLDSWANDINLSKEYFALERQRVRLTTAYDHALELQKSGESFNNSRVDEISLKIESVLSQIEEINLSINEYSRFRLKFDEASYALQRYQQKLQQLQMLSDQYKTAFDKEFVNQVSAQILSHLSEIELKVNRYKIHAGIIKDLENSLKESEVLSERMKILHDEMSPTTGLIADVVKEFMVVFVGKLNLVIDSVWTYPLNVLPCKEDKDDLDYKFPVKVFNSDKPRPDVSKTSSSQVDIFNFAFKLVVMSLLGLSDLPLYLDELGSSMDEQHRINIMKLIDGLVESKRASQMFFISHEYSMHAQFVNAQICAMDTSNIINLPSVYNQHVLMQ